MSATLTLSNATNAPPSLRDVIDAAGGDLALTLHLAWPRLSDAARAEIFTAAGIVATATHGSPSARDTTSQASPAARDGPA
jgi:hypothetical protein